MLFYRTLIWRVIEAFIIIITIVLFYMLEALVRRRVLHTHSCCNNDRVSIHPLTITKPILVR
jgi:hypothetical protein